MAVSGSFNVVLLAVAIAFLSQCAALRVHLIPHTHNDVGWLKTVDQCATGLNTTLQRANVNNIISSVILSLSRNPARKFTYVEQAFFQRWWRRQDEEVRALVRRLHSDGQLEFANGGWCMHDEATAHYVAMVDQTTFGHAFIKEQFNDTPTSGWQLDPFGHSSTQASLLSRDVGFDSLYFGRIDYQDLATRKRNNATEMVWEGVFTVAMDAVNQEGTYGPPIGFDFDTLSNDDIIQDDELMSDCNVDDKVERFVQACLERASFIQGDDIMFMMGNDYRYEAAEDFFAQMDKLIEHTNKDGRVEVMYSTPRDYTAAKNKDNISWPLKTDDFFPYADAPHAYWGGYFTSRPTHKFLNRYASAYLQSARQLELHQILRDGQVKPTPLGRFFENPGELSGTSPLAEAVGLSQHHDAVTGTGKEHVASDWAKRMAEGMKMADGTTLTAMAALVGDIELSASMSTCHLLNVSECLTSTTSNAFSVLLYNPLGTARKESFRLPVRGDIHFTVADQNLVLLPTTVIPLPASSTLNDGHSIFPLNEIEFVAEVPALSYSAYYFQQANTTRRSLARSDAGPRPSLRDSLRLASNIVLENDGVRLEVDQNGVIVSFGTVTDGKVILMDGFTAEPYYYPSYEKGGEQNSGAYILRNGGPAIPVAKSHIPQSFQILYDHTSLQPVAVEQHWADWMVVTVRLPQIGTFLDVSYKVGPIPIEDGVGKEVFIKYSSASIKNGGVFYTDSNGRQMIKRKLNYRETWDLNCDEPVGCNYYPLTAVSFIRDNANQLTVITDRSQGAASLAEGELEIMIHRRILADDGRGVGEPLNETSSMSYYPYPQRIGPGITVIGKHKLLYTPAQKAAAVWRPLAQSSFSALFPILDNRSQIEGRGPPVFPNFSLPENVAVMTLQALPKGILFRLQHIYDDNEDAELSKCASVNLHSLFSTLKLSSITEVSLTNNQLKRDMKQLNWRVKGADMDTSSEGHLKDDGSIEICAMQIRTFVLTIDS